jgi:hypothetical protein
MRESLQCWRGHSLGTLQHKARALEIQLSDCGLRRLDKSEAFLFFRRLVNYEPDIVAAGSLNYDTHLDYFMADSAIAKRTSSNQNVRNVAQAVRRLHPILTREGDRLECAIRVLSFQKRREF